MADFVYSDTNTKLRVNCLKRDGSIFNLVGYTVQLKFRIGATPYVAQAMTIVDDVNGIAEFEFATGHLGNEGIMYLEIEVNDGQGVTSSAEVLTFTVRGKVI